MLQNAAHNQQHNVRQAGAQWGN